MPKIIDCFIFYNEIDILTYRLNILNNLVDYFIIVESTHTFVGNNKKLYFNDNKHLFELFNDKIIHIIVDDFPYKLPTIINDAVTWPNEKYQRNAISKGINKLNNLTDDDIIIISDVDEIPNPEILKNIKKGEYIININIIEMDMYYYDLNSRFKHKWRHPKILSYANYKQFNNNCDDIRNYCNIPIIYNGGWHLSCFGDKYFIKNKLQNFSHVECNVPEFTNLDNIQEKIDKSLDIIGRDLEMNFIKLEDNNNLPPNYDKYLYNYIKKNK
jgi:beta-1,4-mannosyl-glycoprotein beta-1,4-N-acetylglucosaminyltransferase